MSSLEIQVCLNEVYYSVEVSRIISSCMVTVQHHIAPNGEGRTLTGMNELLCFTNGVWSARLT